ncbi:hypothetical protein, partial [Staphylococcus haemolyticus]|uniref:hypothetical protein n=1 Tax=Staphylococcus haemolyticus TaxID=1283 RepID=UPI0021B49D95
MNHTILTFHPLSQNLHKIKLITKPHQIHYILNPSIPQTITPSLNTLLTLILLVLPILIFAPSTLFNFSLP